MHPYARMLLDSASAAIAADSPLLGVAADASNSSASNGTNLNAPPSDSSAEGYMNSRFSPSMAIIVVVLLSAFFFMAFFSIYVRRCTTDDEFTPPGGRRPRSVRGLDRAMVESLPMVSYSADQFKVDTDSSGCVVCLTDFEDGEPLRSLPKCQHCFHPACIDLWLDSHTTCPMCRRSLLPDKESSQRGSSNNRVMAASNEENVRESSTLDTEFSLSVGAVSDASRPEVAVTVLDMGAEQEGMTQNMNQSEENLSITQSSATGESDQTDGASWRLHDSPIHGVMSSSPSPFQGREAASPQRELRRANSTGHSLVKRAFSRANCLIPVESDDLAPPLPSCLPIGASVMSGLHRSRSHTFLPLSLTSGDEQNMEGESELSTMRLDGLSRRWNFSFRPGFSLRRSPENVLATTLGESSSASVRRTFERLPV